MTAAKSAAVPTKFPVKDFFGVSPDIVRKCLENHHIADWTVEIGNPADLSTFTVHFAESQQFKELPAVMPLPDYINLIHPEDREKLMSALHKALGSVLFEAVSCRLVWNGTVRHQKLSGFPVFDEHGKLVRLFGFSQDFTDAYKLEQRYQILYDNSHDAIYVSDETRFGNVNKRTLELFGYDSLDEFLTLTPSALAPEFQADGRSSDEFLREKLGIYKRDKHVKFDCLSKRKNGTVFETTVEILPMPDEERHYQVVINDVSEERMINRALDNHRSYISLIAEIRKSFYQNSEEEIIQTYLETAALLFELGKCWYGTIENDVLQPVFHAGLDKHHTDLASLKLKSDLLDRGFPLRKAIETKQPLAANLLEPNDSGVSPWDSFIQHSQSRSVLAVPVEMYGSVKAGIVFHSRLTNAFDETTVDYLDNSVKELARIITEKRAWLKQQQMLEKAKEEAEAVSRAKARFLANISHEIRTPMTSVVGYLEMLLRDHPLTKIPDGCNEQQCIKCLEQYRGTLKVIQNNAEYLLSLLTNVLDISKMEVNQLDAEIIDVPLRPLLYELSSLYSAQAKSKGLQFQIKILTPMPEILRTDPIRIRQILVNLISNAFKFTTKGSISVSVGWGASRSNENTEEDGELFRKGSIFFAVQDTGIGISADAIPQLFVPFQQGDMSITRRFGGTGLGLAISKQLVELLGGEITVSSVEDTGSTFRVLLPQTLPRKATFESFTGFNDQAKQISESSWKKNLFKPQDTLLNGVRILLAEDGEDNQRLFTLILQKAGADVQTADNGQTACQTALEQLSTGKPFDLILMDMQMPVMDGYSAVRHLRNLQYKGPIAALTAHSSADEKQKCLNAGCDDYAVKPILRDALIAMVLKNIRK
ncbi:MAG: response regulator [Planctomycetaceae bacterium]|jgi:PAS domain S-box-containing protein|nr:response regulator [Planctomycetaceae bacterium]